jgi:peptide methionine sulfoxide reductase MsrA
MQKRKLEKNENRPNLKSSIKLKSRIRNMSFIFLMILLFVPAGSGMAEANIEVGLVKWNRNFEESLKQSRTENKPALILFQEVPGCSGCQKFGRDVLSHPLIVEAIESEFIPVLVYNNRGGKDAELLKKYHEPAWNFQVIRFLDNSGKDIIPRQDRVWSIGEVAGRMCSALQKAGKKVPMYLQGLALEYNNPHLKQVVFAMHCFWTGEMCLGSIKGVVKTQAGYLRHKEVTRVWYDETLISFKDIVHRATQAQCAERVYIEANDAAQILETIKRSPLKIKTFKNSEYRKASKSDQKKQAQGSKFKKLNLTAFQKTKVNAFIRRDINRVWTYLSPRQKARLEKRKKHRK